MNQIIEKDFVVTSKGNHGVVVSVGAASARVKIGYKVHEIELYNLTKITDGTSLAVTYKDDDGNTDKEIIFIKHNQPLFSNGTLVILEYMNKYLRSKLGKEVVIIEVKIP